MKIENGKSIIIVTIDPYRSNFLFVTTDPADLMRRGRNTIRMLKRIRKIVSLELSFRNKG
jgi:hypothetical protein